MANDNRCPHCGALLPARGAACPQCRLPAGSEPTGDRPHATFLEDITLAGEPVLPGIAPAPPAAPVPEPPAPKAPEPPAPKAPESPAPEAPVAIPPAPVPASAPAPSRPVPPGAPARVIGDYEILHEIARGGMGVVFKARQRSLNRMVALKLMLAGFHASEEVRRRFQREAQMAAQLHHPNIVPIYEVGEQEGQPYFSMELVEGTDLARQVRDQPLSPRRAASYVCTVAQAVHYAHEKGILHRDLKPSNILVGDDDRPRITDFGLARNLDATSSLTLSGSTLGSPAYLPPEQLSVTHGQAGPWSDVYGLGAVLYHLLTGRPPFLGSTLADTLEQVMQSEPAAPRMVNPAIPPELETICLKCLRKRPKERYASASELAAALREWLDAESRIQAPVTPSPSPAKPAPKVRLSKKIFIGYRRDGAEDTARLVRDALRRRHFKVFMDVEDLRSGPFHEALLAEIRACTDFVLVLTPGCLDRCFDPGDWLRREIIAAMAEGKNIVPVAAGEFEWPALPAEMSGLKNYQILFVSRHLFEPSMDKLATWLRPPVKVKRSLFYALAGAVSITLLALLISQWAVLRTRPPVPRDHFTQSVFFHGPGGTNDPVVLAVARVDVEVNGRSSVVWITNSGVAQFDFLPSAWAGQTGRLQLDGGEWRLVASPGQIVLGTNPVSVAVEVPRRPPPQPPAPTNFSQVFVFHGSGGTNQAVPLGTANALLNAGNQTFTAPIGKDGQAQFKDLPPGLLRQAATLSLSTARWRLEEGSARPRLTGEAQWLEVTAAGADVQGVVRSASDGSGLGQVSLRLGEARTNTGPGGAFSFFLTTAQLARATNLEAMLNGYDAYRETFSAPPTNRPLEVTLRKTPTDFSFSLFFHEPGGTNRPLAVPDARVSVAVDGKTYPGRLTEGRRAVFEAVPMEHLGHTGLVSFTADQWVNHGNGEIALTQSGAWIELRPKTVEVRGRILNAEDGQPVSGAAVVLGGSRTNADSRGEFSVSMPKNEAETVRQMEVSAAGYSPATAPFKFGAEPMEVRLAKIPAPKPPVVEPPPAAAQPVRETPTGLDDLLSEAEKLTPRNPAQAEQLFRQARSQYPNEPKSAAGYGMFLQKVGRTEEARAQVSAAVDQARRTGDQSQLAWALNSQGIVLGSLRQFPQAETAYGEALQLYRTLTAGAPGRFRDVYAVCLNNRGIMRKDAGNLAGARQDFEEALKLRETLARSGQVRAQVELAEAMVNLASVQGGMGERDKATAQLQRGIGLYRSVAQQDPGVAEAMAAALITLAEMQERAADFKTALESHKQACDAYRKAAERAPSVNGAYGVELNNYSLLLEEHGGPTGEAAALEGYGKAVDAFKALPASYQQRYGLSLASTLHNFAKLLRATRQQKEAQARFEQALAAYNARPKGADRTEGLASAEFDFASLLAEMKQPAEARKLYESSVTRYEELAATSSWTNHHDFATVLNNFAIFLTKGGADTAAAQRVYQQALALCASRGDHPLRVKILNNLGALLQDLGNFPLARMQYEEALKACDKIREDDGSRGLYRAQTLLGCAQLEYNQSTKGTDPSLKSALKRLDETQKILGRLAPSAEVDKLKDMEKRQRAAVRSFAGQ